MILTTLISHEGPASRENCYRLMYNNEGYVDNFDYGDGYTRTSFNLFLATTHQEITDYCTINGINFDPNDWPMVDFTH
jgi:hypothetical protein